MRLRQRVIAFALAVFVAVAIFASLPTVALADSAVGAHESFQWGYLLLGLIVILVVLSPLTAGFVLVAIRKKLWPEYEDPPEWEKNQENWWGRPR